MEARFTEMNTEELQNTEGGVAWVAIGVIGVCAIFFCMGAYNGYKGNS